MNGGACLVVESTEDYTKLSGSLMPLPSTENETTQTHVASSPPQIPFLETPLVGQDGPDAGFWATRANECPWQKAFKLKKKPSENLHTLIALPTQREPALRKEEDPLEFDNHVSQKKSNIEALLAQAVGAEVSTNAKEKVPRTRQRQMRPNQT
ncbi:hypothetical protein E8E15_008463 [Penicillium rubens]|nr:hypothetical protein E8E15_008463 [Penicillium rubens]KAJ5034194.1 hypothetical protein NUH16_005625 [Penicillium rubens]